MNLNSNFKAHQLKRKSKNTSKVSRNTKTRSVEKSTEEKSAVPSNIKKAGKKGSSSKQASKLKKTASKLHTAASEKGKRKKEKEEKTGGSKLNKSISKTFGNSAKKKEKWAGEEASVAWTKTIVSLNLVNEYEEIKKIVTQDERCKIWATNMERNRHKDYKCYDDNRVIVQMAKCDYINATKINVPNFSRVAYLVQMPRLDLTDSVEEFWRMIFTEQCTSVHIIVQPNELDGVGMDKLFAQEAGQYFYANGFFVNTRKVERNAQDKLDTHVVELLPEGCSNSVMCQVYTHTYWKAQGGPEKFLAPIKAAQMISKMDFDSNPVAIVSLRGAGRNASLLSLAVIVSQFNKGIEPKIKDVVRAIREQRPMAVDSVTQYISLYLATCWLVKAKVPTSQAEVHSRMKTFKAKCAPSSSQMSLLSTDGDTVNGEKN